MNSTTSPNPMTSTPDQALITRALTAHVTDTIAKELLHFDALNGKAERGASWDTTTEADRQHYRARARRELRQQDPCALDVAMTRAKQAAFSSLPASSRIFMTDDARKDFERAVEAGIGARDAHLMYGKPDQPQPCQVGTPVEDIPPTREFTVIDGGRTENLAECSWCRRTKPVCCDTGYQDLPDGTTKHDDPFCRDCCQSHHGRRVESAQQSEGEVRR